MITTALVAIGGHGSRIVKRGIDVPISKSFLEQEGKPILFWVLLSLYKYGVRELVLTAETKLKLNAGKAVIKTLPVVFSRVCYEINHPTNGSLKTQTGGIPFELRHKLPKSFIYEFGHKLTDPAYYAELESAKLKKSAVYTLYYYRIGSSVTWPVQLQNGKVVSLHRPSRYGLNSPFLLDRVHVLRLPKFQYSDAEAITYYLSHDSLGVVSSTEIPEFDYVHEMKMTFKKQAYLIKELRNYFDI